MMNVTEEYAGTGSAGLGMACPPLEEASSSRTVEEGNGAGDARSLEQKRKEAQRLSAARRAQKPVQKRPRVFGAHLSRLARSLPHHRPLSATLNDISLISSGPESSPKKSLPMEHLTSFQVKEVERVQAEYESARAATPSHQNEIFSQVGPALLLGRKFSNWPMNLSSPNKSAR